MKTPNKDLMKKAVATLSLAYLTALVSVFLIFFVLRSIF